MKSTQKFNAYSIAIITLLLTSLAISASAAPDVYLPIITSDPSLSSTIFVTGDRTTMDANLIDGRLHVSDSVHSTQNLRVLESMLINRLNGYKF